MHQKKSAMEKSTKRLWFGRFFKMAVIAAAIYLLILFPNITSTLDQIHEPMARGISGKRVEKAVLEEKDPISVLLLGIDERENDRGRSDTMIVLTLNPTEKSTKMVSIPRDTYTEIIGLGKFDKINHAYAFGGMESAIDSTENLLDIPIDYVIQVNMQGFEDIVDAIGGVQVNNPFAFDDFESGELSLDGEQALDFVRMRKDDPEGDFGRQDRQKQVIRSAMEKAATVTALFNYPKILDALGNNVRTNMDFGEMIDVQSNYRSAISTIDQISFQEGYGETMDGIWYYMTDDEELENIQQTLKVHLEIEK